jgi:hypothetical protein
MNWTFGGGISLEKFLDIVSGFTSVLTQLINKSLDKCLTILLALLLLDLLHLLPLD